MNLQDLALPPGTLPTMAANPFENLDALRLPQSFGDSGAKKLLTRVPVGKPDRQKFVRVRAGQEWRLTTLLLEDKANREYFLVSPQLWEVLRSEATPFLLALAVDRADNPSIWPVRLPDPNGRGNPWNETAFQAVGMAEKRWIRLVANQGAGCYDVFEATGPLSEPNWPPESLAELLKLAFQGKIIESLDHPMVRQLQGQS